MRWSERRDGWKDGGSNSTETTGALNTLALDTRTNTHKPSGDSNLRAIFRPDDWQLDAYSSPTRPADNSSYPIPSLSSLVLPLSPSFFFLFFVALTLSTPPSPDHLLLPSLILLSILLPPSLSLSLGLLWGYYNDRGDKGHLSHVRRGEREKALNRSRGRNTQTHTHKCPYTQH